MLARDIALQLIPGTSSVLLFKESPIPAYREAYARLYLDKRAFIELTPQGWSTEDNERAVYEGRAAFYLDQLYIDMRRDAFLASYGEVPFRMGDAIGRQVTSYVVPKGCPYKADLDRAVGFLFDTGVVEHLKYRGLSYRAWLDMNNKGGGGGGSAGDIVAFRLSHLLGAFIVLSIGLVVSILVFILEESKVSL